MTEVKSLTTSSLAHGLTTIIVVAGSRAVRGKTTVSGVSNGLIYCYIFFVCKKIYRRGCGPYGKIWRAADWRQRVRHRPTVILDTVVRMYCCTAHKRRLRNNPLRDRLVVPSSSWSSQCPAMRRPLRYHEVKMCVEAFFVHEFVCRHSVVC